MKTKGFFRSVSHGQWSQDKFFQENAKDLRFI
jgi:hypothetical protein